MNLTILKEFRKPMYGCFERSKDALFNVSDARLRESQARSLPELSLSVFFERSFPSVYEALQDGRIDVNGLRKVFVQALIANDRQDEPIWMGLDSSGMERLEAGSNRDRGMIYVPNMPHATKPVSVGWQFSTLMLLPDDPSRWVGIVDQQRIATEQTAIDVGIAQLRAVLPLITRRIIVLADRWYAVARFLCACRDLGCSERRSNGVRPANMDRCFREHVPRPMDGLMPSGKEPMNRASACSSRAGSICISERLQRRKSR